MTDSKQEHGLVSHFKKRYKEHYGVDPKVNRYSARWGFRDILMDVSYDEGKALIDYYFHTVSPSGHDLTWFFYNYEKLAEAKEKTDSDRDELAVIRERTRKRTEEWRAKRANGNT